MDLGRAQQAGRRGGLKAWALNPPDVMIGPAHAGFRRRFERLVLEAAAARGEELSAAEVDVRAERLKRAHMLELAAKSAKARRRPDEAA